jgi:hypothetical protein
MNNHFALILLVIIAGLCSAYLYMNPVVEKPSDGYLHWIYNKPELRPQVKEHEYSPCGISDKAFVKYVHKFMRKYNIELTRDVRWKLVDKLPGSAKNRCIGFAVLYMKEPMAVYRKRRAEEKKKEK